SAAAAEGYAHRPTLRHSGAWVGGATAALFVLAALWALSRARLHEQVANMPQPPRLAAAVAQRDDTGAFTLRLPNNFELTAPATGIEKKIVVFVEDPSRKVEQTTWFNFDGLLFETGSASLKPESKAQLKNVAEIMEAYPNVKAKIGGYTDNAG